MVLPVLLLLVGLAFIATTLLSRRMYLPVQALTDHAVLEERTRLAREIHDTLAQGFSSIIVLLQAAEAGLAGPGLASARRQLELAAQTARENLADARALIGALSPASLVSESLPGALRRVTERAAAEAGISASFDVSGTPRPLTAASDVVLLRVGQEALANVRKHAAAGSVQVLLRYQPAAVSLAVTDDGQGFDPARVNGTCVRAEVPA